MSVNIYSHFTIFLWLHAEMAFQFKICCRLFSSNNLTFLSSDSTTVCHISLHICRSGNFPQILTTIGLSIRFSLSLINFLIPLTLSLPVSITWYLSNPLAALAHHHLSPLLDLQLAQLWKSLIAHFGMHHLTSEINLLAHFVNHVLVFLFLIHHSITVISVHLYPHHFHHPSHLISLPAQNIPFSQIFSYIDPGLL